MNLQDVFRRSAKVFFWDPPHESENNVQTIVRVLGNLFRTSVSLVIVATLITLAVVGVRALPTKADRALQMLEITYRVGSEAVEFAPSCDEGSLVVLVINRNPFSVTNIRVQIEARYPDRSVSALAGYSWEHTQTMDSIFEPDGGYGFCWTAPIHNDADMDALVWNVTAMSLELWDE